MALSANNVAKLWVAKMGKDVPDSAKKNIVDMEKSIEVLVECIYQDMLANGNVVGTCSMGGSVVGKIS